MCVFSLFLTTVIECHIYFIRNALKWYNRALRTTLEVISPYLPQGNLWSNSSFLNTAPQYIFLKKEALSPRRRDYYLSLWLAGSRQNHTIFVLWIRVAAASALSTKWIWHLQTKKITRKNSPRRFHCHLNFRRRFKKVYYYLYLSLTSSH